MVHNIGLFLKLIEQGVADEQVSQTYAFTLPTRHTTPQIRVKMITNENETANSLLNNRVISNALVTFRPRVSLVSIGHREIINGQWGKGRYPN